MFDDGAPMLGIQLSKNMRSQLRLVLTRLLTCTALRPHDDCPLSPSRAVFPDHKGGLGFKPFFAVTPQNKKDVTEALKVIQEKCLPDPKVRKLWIRSLDQAMLFMLSFDGEPATLANGRMLEFKFLKLALQRYTG
jgi:hypothetical protein